MRHKLARQHNADRFRALQAKTIIQRNLVNVTNIAFNLFEKMTLAQIAQTLHRYEFFGQYGDVVKIIPNIKTLHNIQSSSGPSFSAYITYRSAESSTQCIRATNGSWLAGKALNASLGTTKYCSHFLRNKQCTNADCTYLHQLVSERDYITKDELTQSKNRVDEALSQRVAFDAAGGTASRRGSRRRRRRRSRSRARSTSARSSSGSSRASTSKHTSLLATGTAPSKQLTATACNSSAS